MISTKIPVDKIGDVIGKSGKVIQKLQADYEVEISIEDDGSVYISGLDLEKAQQVVDIIRTPRSALSTAERSSA